MGQAESILKRLLEDEDIEKVSEETPAEPVDYLKLAEELEKLSNESEERPMADDPFSGFTKLEKTAFDHVIAETLREISSKIKEGR